MSLIYLVVDSKQDMGQEVPHIHKKVDIVWEEDKQLLQTHKKVVEEDILDQVYVVTLDKAHVDLSILVVSVFRQVR